MTTSLGQTYLFKVAKTTHFGAYLAANELGEILLPNKNGGNKVSEGQVIEVFIYLDSEDRPIATTQKPKIRVGEFAYLKAVASTPVGMFLDWGLDKDLLVPFGEQHKPMEVGHSYIVHCYLDRIDGRVTASSKIDKFLSDDRAHSFQVRQEVNLLVANSTNLGFKTIVDNSHWGVLYQSEVFQRLSFGQTIKGVIKHIRPDGKIDVSLQAGQQTRDKHAETIVAYLKKHHGFAPLHDKTDPKDIAVAFGISKAAFKKTIGNLYKKGVIVIQKDGIKLLDEK